jgi:hypothetical protein
VAFAFLQIATYIDNMQNRVLITVAILKLIRGFLTLWFALVIEKSLPSMFG